MDGANVVQYTFRRNEQAVTLGAKHGIKLMGRMYMLLLGTHPPAMFDKMGMMRKANKPALADVMWTQHTPKWCIARCSACSGWRPSLAKVTMASRYHLQCNCKALHDYVQKKYGRSMNMVFDGYEGGPLTKDSTPINAAVKGMLNQQSTKGAFPC